MAEFADSNLKPLGGHPSMTPCPYCQKLFFPWSLKFHLKACNEKKEGFIRESTEEDRFDSLSDDSFNDDIERLRKSNQKEFSREKQSLTFPSRKMTPNKLDVDESDHYDNSRSGSKSGKEKSLPERSFIRTEDYYDKMNIGSKSNEMDFRESFERTPTTYRQRDQDLFHGEFQEDIMGSRRRHQNIESSEGQLRAEAKNEASVNAYDEKLAYQKVYEAFERSEQDAASSPGTPLPRKTLASPQQQTQRTPVSRSNRPTRDIGNNRPTSSPMRSAPPKFTSPPSSRSVSEMAREGREKAERLRNEREEYLVKERARLQKQIDEINNELKLIRTSRSKTNQTITPAKQQQSSSPSQSPSRRPLSSPKLSPSRFDTHANSGYDPKSIDPSNASSPDNPLVTNVYQVLPHPRIIPRAPGSKFIV